MNARYRVSAGGRTNLEGFVDLSHAEPRRRFGSAVARDLYGVWKNRLHLGETLGHTNEIDDPQLAEIGLLEIRVVEDSKPDRLEDRDRDRASFILELLNGPAGIKVRCMTVGRAGGQAGEEEGHAANVVKRQRRPDPVISRQFETGLGNSESMANQCFVRKHHALWIGGCSRCVHDDRRVSNGHRSVPREDQFV